MPFQSPSESDASVDAFQASSSTLAPPPDSAALLAVALQRICESHEFPAFSRQMSELLVACHFPSAYTTIGRVAGERLARAERDRAAARRMPVTSAAPITLDQRAASTVAAWQLLGFSFEDPGDAVLARHGDRLQLSPEQLGEVLSAAVAETRAVFAEAGVTVDALEQWKQSFLDGALAGLRGPMW